MNTSRMKTVLICTHGKDRKVIAVRKTPTMEKEHPTYVSTVKTRSSVAPRACDSKRKKSSENDKETSRLPMETNNREMSFIKHL